MEDKKILPFVRVYEQDGMGRKRAAIKTEERDQFEDAKQPRDSSPAERDETIAKKTIGLPAYVWEVLSNDAKQQRRTIARQIEVILVNHYQLGSTMIQDVNHPPGSFGFVSYQRKKAS